jgi:hypothetical protein
MSHWLVGIARSLTANYVALIGENHSTLEQFLRAVRHLVIPGRVQRLRIFWFGGGDIIVRHCVRSGLAIG